MKHAGKEALDKLEGLLERIRKIDGIKEKKLGIFYRGSKAFLHFHEDPKGLFADLSVNTKWKRFPVNSTIERDKLYKETVKALY